MSNLFTESPLLENSKRRNGTLPGRYRKQVRCLTGELRDCLDETISMGLGRVFAEAQLKSCVILCGRNLSAIIGKYYEQGN
jgi:hypothetical protein